MDDSCAVCAETLEWVAYGSCGHKEVCSTCVARLRFICNDRRCCICKTESSFVFVTKALGDYTRMINDFSVLPSEVKKGRAGTYWYHEDTQAFFDVMDHYKMIKAMCRLSCSVCDKSEENPTNGPRRRARFWNIEQLKGHLFHQHGLMMCSLCLEGRKVFIYEQRLYTRAQLNQHINTGDSDVDGTESERGGFMGHPLCEFCRSPFYGDNELYTHMSTEHYTCHICQRHHPGQYEYYKNYDDLELHFRQEHFLCEDEACLAKKFIVFQSEAEMKRHNTLEHAGRMSRSKRNAALQIPTSFRYRRSNEQDNRHGRGQTFRRDLSDAELSLSRAIEASFETTNIEGRFHESLSSNTPVVSDHREMNDIDPIIQPFESLATADSEPPSRYLQALSHKSRNTPLVESSFPPLPMAPGGSQQKSINDPESSPQNTMAENLRRKNKKKVNELNTAQAQAWPAAGRVHVGPSVSPVHSRPANSSPGSSPMPGQNKPAVNQRSAGSSQSSFVQAQPLSFHEPLLTGSLTSSSSWGSTSSISHSTSAPNLVDSGSVSDFPPVSTVQMRELPSSGQSMRNVEDVYAANKSMVERIRAVLEFDQDKYATFKEISGEYRQGLIDAGTYLAYVEQFGLSHLILDLARLCPDPRKEKDLIDTHNANLIGNEPHKNARINGISKGKSVVSENSSSKANLTDSILSTVRELQSNYRPLEEEVEMLSKDGYRRAKGKSKLGIDEPRAELSQPSPPLLKLKVENNPRSAGGGSYQNSGVEDGKSKQRKKTNKFHRARLGDGSMAALLNRKNSDFGSDSAEAVSDGNKDLGEGLPVRGVWKNGGGHRLLGKTLKDPRN